MTNGQVTVADYCPNWWPVATRLLIRCVQLDPGTGQISTDPRTRRRRTLHPDQRALPLAAAADAVYGYSFIVTNLDVFTAEQAAAVEHWYRHRTQVENCDAKLGAALRHMPSGHPEVNQAWMWGGCWRCRSPAGRTSSPPAPTPTGGWSGTASAAARP
jgi:hypothetical protein